MINIKKPLMFIIGVRDSAFKYGTTTMQLVNIWFTSSFFLAFAFNGDKLVETPAYVNFIGTDWWLYMGAVAVLQFLFLIIPSLRCNILAGFVLLVSAPLWGVVSINFADAIHFNTGVMAYAGVAFGCGMGGWKLMDLYDFKLSVKLKTKHVHGGDGDAAMMERSDVGKPIDSVRGSGDTASHICDARRPDGCLRPCDTESQA